jgi:transcriptional regulator with XRE-family HTH domain
MDPAYCPTPSGLGEHLRRRRLDLGLSQADVARLLEASENSIWNWENGRSTPALRFMPRIVSFLGNSPTGSRVRVGQPGAPR